MEKPGPKVDPKRGRTRVKSITLYPYQIELVKSQPVGFSEFVQTLIDDRFSEREVARAKRKAKRESWRV